MFSFKGIPIKLFALVMAIIAIVGGVYLTFFQSRGFVKTQATIVSIEEVADEFASADSKEHRVTVEYTVDGVTYTEELGAYSPSYAEGKAIDVLYDPKDPSVVHAGTFMGIYAMCVGVVILAVIAVTELRKRRGLEDVKSRQAKDGGAAYPASEPGPQRKLYFITDLGTAKVGHRIEDADRNVLYEAKMTKFTMTAPFEFDFIDHEHGRTTPHMVSHEEATDWGNSLLLDNHFTFSFDGEDIWKHLKRNGVAVNSSLNKHGRVVYRISRQGREIAVAVGSSQNVHEEDAEAKSKLASLVPVQGFYRVETTERDLALLFVTLLAFARSGASDDRGGNFGTIVNTVKKIVD